MKFFIFLVVQVIVLWSVYSFAFNRGFRKGYSIKKYEINSVWW